MRQSMAAESWRAPANRRTTRTNPPVANFWRRSPRWTRSARGPESTWPRRHSSSHYATIGSTQQLWESRPKAGFRVSSRRPARTSLTLCGKSWNILSRPLRRGWITLTVAAFRDAPCHALPHSSSWEEESLTAPLRKTRPLDAGVLMPLVAYTSKHHEKPTERPATTRSRVAADSILWHSCSGRTPRLPAHRTPQRSTRGDE